MWTLLIATALASGSIAFKPVSTHDSYQACQTNMSRHLSTLPQNTNMRCVQRRTVRNNVEQGINNVVNSGIVSVLSGGSPEDAMKTSARRAGENIIHQQVDKVVPKEVKRIVTGVPIDIFKQKRN